MAWAPVEHAVTTEWFGPRKPKRMETCPEARLIRAEGMKNGLILRGPLSRNRREASWMVLRSADAGTDQNSRTLLFVVIFGEPVGILNRLLCSGNGIDDEIIHAPLFLGIDVAVRIEFSVGCAARRLSGNLRGEIVDRKILDPAYP